jgi:hypothetical protein
MDGRMLVDADAAASVLPLTSGVRETMVMHACQEHLCRVAGGTVQHSGSIGEGSEFYVYGRRSGYPPRSA